MKATLTNLRRWLLIAAGLAAMPAAILAQPLPAWAPMAAASEAALAGAMAPVSGGGFLLAEEAGDPSPPSAPMNPCAAPTNPCNPCAPKNPCGDAPANPCNPCGGTTPPSNPCQAKNPCGDAASTPANPCEAYNADNPCGAQAKNPCNPCSATSRPMAAAGAAKAKGGNSMVVPGILGLAAVFMAVKSLAKKKD